MLSAMKTEKIGETQDLPMMLSDAAWNSILPFLKVFPNVYVGKPETCRRFLLALVWITKQGATWHALPKTYGYWNTIYRRFGRWWDAGVFEKLHEHFHEVSGEISALLVDSMIVRAHASAAGVPKKTEAKNQRHSVGATGVLPRNSMLL